MSDASPAPAVAASILEVRGVGKRFGGLVALAGVSFSIREGEHAWMVWRWPWSVRWNRLFTIVR